MILENFSQDSLLQLFSQYVYSPAIVYSTIIFLMTASSFGLPIPEEVTLVSAGLVAYMGRSPEAFPPPYPGAESVRLFTLATVCFLAVMGSDILIYFIGRMFGEKIVKTKFFHKRIGRDRFEKMNSWFNRYSAWACGIFRFTPGLRFPGHMSCGLLKIPLWKFVTIDGLAALLSVPTQVILVAFYGEVIIEVLREVKMAIAVLILGILIFFVAPRLYRYYKNKKEPT